MPESKPSNVLSATSPSQLAPNPPVLVSIVFNRLAAEVAVTMPTDETDGTVLVAGSIKEVKVIFAEAGADLSAATPVVFTGPFDPGSEQKFTVNVEKFETAYDFEAIVSN